MTPAVKTRSSFPIDFLYNYNCSCSCGPVEVLSNLAEVLGWGLRRTPDKFLKM